MSRPPHQMIDQTTTDQPDALGETGAGAVLPHVIERRYTDIEAQSLSVPGHEQTYLQLAPGAFEGSLLTHYVSKRASFFIERTNRSVRKRLCVSPGHLRLGFTLDERHHCCGNGVMLLGDSLSVNL